MTEKFGPTGEFPDGKLHEGDEGALNMGIAHDPFGNVHVNFGSPIEWFALPREKAIDLAKMLLLHAGAKLVHIELFDLPKGTKQ